MISTTPEADSHAMERNPGMAGAARRGARRSVPRGIHRLARRSLYIIAAVEFGMPLVSLLFGLLLD